LEDQKEDNLKVWSEFNKLRIQFKGGILWIRLTSCLNGRTEFVTSWITTNFPRNTMRHGVDSTGWGTIQWWDFSWVFGWSFTLGNCFVCTCTICSDTKVSLFTTLLIKTTLYCTYILLHKMCTVITVNNI
jgi:hypothetical protein